MAKVERVERGICRVENKDGSISWMIDYLNPEKNESEKHSVQKNKPYRKGRHVKGQV
jgi:hypothetical protein